MADFYRGQRYERGVIPPIKFTLITAAAPVAAHNLPDGTRGIRCGTAGTLSGTMQDGSVFADLPLFQGDNPGHFATITGGTAENLWAIE